MATSLTTPSGASTYHPGPLLFWLLAPGMRLFGPAVEASVGAALINKGSILAMGGWGSATPQRGWPLR